MIYLAVFFLSTGLFFLAGKSRGGLHFFLIVCAVLLPCVMAGIRSHDIGTDVTVYGIYTFRAARSSGLLEFLDSYSGISPIGFNLVSWFVAKFFGSFEIYLGILQLITIMPVYLAARHTFKAREWLCMLWYFFILFPTSLNIMKQSIAVSIALFGMTLAFRKKPLAYVAITAIACSFHETAVVSLAAYLLFLLFRNGGGEIGLFGRWRALVSTALIAVAMACLFVFGEDLVRILSMFKDSYSYQVEHIGKGDANESILLIGGASLVIWWMCRNFITGSASRIVVPMGKPEPSPTVLYDFSFAMLLLGCIFTQLNIVSDSVGRLGYYFLIYGALFISSLAFDSAGKGQLASFALVFVLISYFVFAFIVRGGSEIYPYVTAMGEVFP